jgi:F-type H+-transporting ATPase subunit b
MTMGHVSASVLASSQAAGEGGTNNFLIPNGTFFVVLVIFLIVLGVIGTFVVPPITRVLRERDAMVRKTAQDIRSAAEQFAAARSDYERAMSRARTESSNIREQARAEGRRVVDEARARASAEAEQALQRAGEELKQQADTISAGLLASVESLATALATRVIGVDIGPTAPRKATTTVSGR